jgi:hypothetical protein
MPAPIFSDFHPSLSTSIHCMEVSSYRYNLKDTRYKLRVIRNLYNTDKKNADAALMTKT